MKRDKKNLYEVLGLSPEADSACIKKAYRELVKKCHPDLEYLSQTDFERVEAKRRMQVINEAYEILINKNKRKTYDRTIQKSYFRRTATTFTRTNSSDSHDNQLEREKYLKKVFHPARSSMVRVLNQYKNRLEKLEQDIFDSELLEEFEKYVDSIEITLRKSSEALSTNPPPESLAASLQWMRHAIAQAVDGLDELRYFCQNYDYDHLAMASNLFKIAIEHSRLANRLSRGH